MIKPQLCHTLASLDDLPADGWVMEPKLDGWRWIVHRTDDRVQCYGGRNGSTHHNQQIEDALAFLPPDTILDGEIIAAGVKGNFNGRTHSGHVSTALANSLPVQFVVFDVIRYNGVDCGPYPWTQRRQLLETIDFDGSTVWLNPYAAPSAELYASWLDLGIEGAVLKRKDSRYYMGRRSHDWLKIKQTWTADAVVTGFVPGKAGLTGEVGAFAIRMLDSGTDSAVNAAGQHSGPYPPRPEDEAKWVGRIIEIVHYGLFEGGQPRSPVFSRLRPDLETPDPTPPVETSQTPAPAVKATSKPRRSPMAEPSRRMRNYQAMRLPKLEQCIAELVAKQGDAYDRCLDTGSGDPVRDLQVALEVQAKLAERAR